ncbi:hypothetical protein CONLIGDRAFT_717269 [Coniochaeta ligniaria NRRL 30616]|uniref:Helicase ATP-binding domain-containing protein n=1 Tax=Coniochaeta ligniaria NRRL 30616 TaxID=1408157 RepID=A0A1J7J6S9_9PEZI|nr:hypothetical protein CONLIGDRAFT_717269 [Coniochaeta ligniaria NRRL 30616]
MPPKKKTAYNPPADNELTLPNEVPGKAEVTVYRLYNFKATTAENIGVQIPWHTDEWPRAPTQEFDWDSWNKPGKKGQPNPSRETLVRNWRNARPNLIPGVRALLPWDMLLKHEHMAGYLGMENQYQFQTFLDTQASALGQYVVMLKNDNWGLPLAPKTYPSNPPMLKCSNIIRNLHKHELFRGLLEQLDAKADIAITAGDVGDEKKGGAEATDIDSAYTAVALAYRFLKFSTTGPQSDTPLFDEYAGTDTEVILKYSGEDWHRALGIVYCLFNRRKEKKGYNEAAFNQANTSSDRYGRWNLASGEGTKGGRTVTGTPFATDDDAKGITSGSSGQGTWDNSASYTAATVFLALQDDQDEEDDELNVVQAEAHRKSAMARIHAATALTIGMVPGAQPLADINNRIASAGLAKPPKPDDLTIKATIDFLMSTVRVVSPDEEDLELSQQAFAHLVDQDARASFLASAETEVSAVSELLQAASTSSDKGADLYAQAQKIVDGSYTIQGLASRYKPWEMDLQQACVELANLIEKPIRSKILASECGTGKTITYLLALHGLQLKKLRMKAQGKSVKFAASLVMVPANVFGQAFQEAYDKFGKTFRLYSYYGDKNTCKDENRRRCTIRKKALLQLLSSLKVAEDDPKAGEVVIFTTYSTFQARATTSSSSRGGEQFKRPQIPKEPKGKGKGKAKNPPKFPPDREMKGRSLPFDLDSDEERVSEYRDEGGDVDEAHGLDENAIENENLGAPEEDEQQIALMRTFEDRIAFIKKNCRLHYGDKSATDLLQYEWAALVCDEAHYLRRVNNSFWNTVACIDCEVFWPITATPMIDSIRDIRGLATLIWLQNYKRIPVGLPAHAWTEPYAFCVEAYNPIIADPDHPVTGDSILRENYPPHETALQLYKEDKFKFWYLFPEMLSQIGRKGFEDHSIELVSHLIWFLQTRRMMRTPITLPNGQVVRPGDGIPGITVRQHEVIASKDIGKELATMVQDMLSKSFFDSVKKHKAKTFSWLENEDEGSPKRRPVRLEDPYGVAGTAKYRLLELVSFDMRNARLYRSVRSERIDPDAIQNVLRRMKIKTGVALEVPINAPILGVSHVENIISNDRDGGLSLQWALTTRERRMVCPADRMALMSFSASDSPILIVGINRMWQHLKEGKRVIMMVDNPWAQQELIMLLSVMSVEVVSIRANHTAEQREEAVAAFTNPASNVQVFVSSLSVSVFGLNLHQCCSRGILLQFGHNASTMIQAFCRTFRIGQPDLSLWDIYKLRGSFYDPQEQRIIDKYIQNVLAEAAIPQYVTSEFAKLALAYELIRMNMGTVGNRMSWFLNAPESLVEYNDAKQPAEFWTEPMARHIDLCFNVIVHYSAMDRINIIPDDGEITQDIWDALDKCVREEILPSIPTYLAELGRDLHFFKPAKTVSRDLKKLADAAVKRARTDDDPNTPPQKKHRTSSSKNTGGSGSRGGKNPGGSGSRGGRKNTGGSGSRGGRNTGGSGASSGPTNRRTMRSSAASKKNGGS